MKRTIGQNIKECIEYVGLSQAQLSRITGITSAGISMYINNERTPEVHNLKLIAEACGTSCDYLLREKDNYPECKEFDISKLPKNDQLEIRKFMQFLNFKRDSN